MSLIKWDPFTELEEMSHRLNRLIGRPGLPASTGSEMLKIVDWTPSADISETETAYLIKAEIPGVNREDVSVTVEDGVLTIQGERKAEKEETGRKFHRIERSYGSFVRSFRLPQGVDDTAAKAEFKDGMLNITLPKSEQAKPRAVSIKVD